MRVGLITNVAPRYNKNKQNVNNSQAQTQSYMTSQNSPSFGGAFSWFAGFRKTAKPVIQTVESALPDGTKEIARTAELAQEAIAPQVIKIAEGSSTTLEKVADTTVENAVSKAVKKKRASRNLEKRAYDTLADQSKYITDPVIREPINEFAMMIDQETAPFVNRLLGKINEITNSANDEAYFLTEVEFASSVMEKYKNYPEARVLMDRISNIKETSYSHPFLFGEPIDLEAMALLFNKNYSATDMQNRYIAKVTDTSTFEGKRIMRLQDHYSTEELFANYTRPEQEEAFNLLIGKTLPEKQKVDSKKLAKAIKLPPASPEAEIKVNSAIVPSHNPRIYFLENNHNGEMIDILLRINAKTLPLFEKALGFVRKQSDIVPLADIVKAAGDPKKARSIANGLEWVRKGKMTLSTLAGALKVKD